MLADKGGLLIRMNKVDFFIMTILLIAAGWCANEAYDEFKNERYLNGVYIYNAEDINVAREFAYNRDAKGDWVCINVAYDMTPKEAYSTCVHECSHKSFSEIYAESCEKNPLKCLEDLNE